MRTTLTWLVVGALIISNGVFALLYFMSKDSSSNGGVATSQPANIESEALESSTEARTAHTAEEFTDISGDRSMFNSKISRFSLDIDDSYQIIVEKDGGADSNRGTILKIGRKNVDEFGNVSLHADDYVKIEAYPSDINGSRDEFVTNDTALQGNIAEETSSKVDGIQARKFTLDGVGKTIKYYFERGGITYFVESWDISSGDTLVMLNDVVKGFSFK